MLKPAAFYSIINLEEACNDVTSSEIEDGEQSDELREVKAELIAEAVTVLVGEMFLA